MSISTIEIIKDRILSATETSKIALFFVKVDGIKGIDATFDSTIETQKRIIAAGEKYLGSYDESIIGHAIRRMSKRL